jgi:hypothetical protein
MPDSENESALEGPAAVHPPADDPAILRRVARTLGIAAVLCLLLAIAVNWIWSPRGAFQAAAASARLGVLATETATPALPKPSLGMLPASVLAYETIARHPVPGQGDRAAEAIYVTLNMEVDVQVPMSVYARVDGFGTDAEARAHVAEVMRGYPVRQESTKVGPTTIARSGYRADEGAWMVAWARGRYSVTVKSGFKDKVPVDKRQFLRSLGMPVVQAVETFQRTGKQGLTF